MMGIAFVVEILSMNLDDCSADVPSFRIPGNVITDIEMWYRHVNLRAIVVVSARISTLKWVSDFTSQEPLLCYNSVYTSLALLLDWCVSH